ncbi:MAG: type IV pilus assembly protein PilM [Patescibacteria group bacterium]|nr:type IV pilus assembly protein PilM [Patescibacteria group bacterium]
MTLPKIIPSFNSIPFIPKVALGIDIGTSSLKIVEISKWAGRKSLKNYGELKAITLYDKPFRTFEKNTLVLSSKDIARALRAIIQESKITSKRAVFSIPDFSSFFTSFELPPMTKEELPGAVDFEARKHVPMPLSEVIFDWQILSGRVKQNTPLKILLVAVPREVVNQYQEIAALSKLELVALEAEAFGLIRATLEDETESMLVLDIGAQSTTVNTVIAGQLHSSRSFDIAGNAFSERIARSLSINAKEADEKKMSKGMEDKYILEILTPLVDLVSAEIKKSVVQFPKDIKPSKLVLAGGTSRLPGLREYLKEQTGIVTEYASPFNSVFYPPILESTIKVMGPSYAVAVGAALRGTQ